MDTGRTYRRKRSKEGRPNRVTVRFTDEEYAEVEAGARLAGWTVAGWVAKSGITAARLVRKPTDR